MVNPEPLFGRDKSPCCAYPQRIVRSRPGGYVTQNCTKCGKPRGISDYQLPEFACPECQGPTTVVTDERKNYAYRCLHCDKNYAVHSIVPAWQEKFAEHGHGIPGVDFEKH